MIDINKCTVYLMNTPSYELVVEFGSNGEPFIAIGRWLNNDTENESEEIEIPFEKLSIDQQILAKKLIKSKIEELSAI